MRVTNSSSSIISVSINSWGDDADRDWWDIGQGGNEYWNRTDQRGFVMAVQRRGQQNSYLIFSDSDIYVYDDYVKDGGRRIRPATDRYYQ
ncbi:hypothetical protein [Xenorhabdus lircayensis]|uniref:Uncharacterized protein n=1 Tax=Xenorhabdus lircayensis TaxID=2763499 RepID=A0ABS0UD52_9GAMM|nr:hypothetical protein [Xenorhabdus lircayensis]MBI6550701.1 hypothetical protein [Xenorhabdus lircayensis]